MKINELKNGQNKVEIQGVIKEISPPREFQKMGRPGRVANSSVADETGSVTLTLWNEDIDRFSEGDTVKVVNGFVKEWQGTLQISAGRYGSLEKVGEETEETEEAEEAEEPEE